jgi:hypothetical protein
MEDTPTVIAARRFLALLQEGNPPSDRELARALDELAMTYHQTPEGEPAEEDATPPSKDYQERYAILSRRFADYGNYAVSDPSEALNKESMVGNAIDDLADIASDLEEVVWRFENVGADEAHWYFRFLYEAHWGRHLRELSHYLHAKIW